MEKLSTNHIVERRVLPRIKSPKDVVFNRHADYKNPTWRTERKFIHLSVNFAFFSEKWFPLLRLLFNLERCLETLHSWLKQSEQKFIKNFVEWFELICEFFSMLFPTWMWKYFFLEFIPTFGATEAFETLDNFSLTGSTLKGGVPGR